MKRLFDTLPSGEKVYAYIIKGGDVTAEILDYGATLRSLVIDGVDVVGGYDTVEPYTKDCGYQGATVGRVGNRIADAKFTIDGVEYKLPKNNGENCLHGGAEFNHKMWKVKRCDRHSVTLALTSPDGECGFPARLEVSVTYKLIKNALMIDYKAVPSKKTPINLTNHSYFNLDGFGGDIKKHILTIPAVSYTEVDESLIPNGKHPDVSGTVFDFRSPRRIGDGLDTEGFSGYDHNFVVTHEKFACFDGKKLGLSAVLENDSLKMSAYSDQPGMQVYSANFLNDSSPIFKGGIKAIKHGAICLEMQIEPNSVNRGVGIYERGEMYTHTTVYTFERKAKR